MAALKEYIMILMLGITPHQFLFSGSDQIPEKPAGDYIHFQLTNATKISISGSSNVNEFTCLAYQDFPPASGIMEVNTTTHKVNFLYTSINIPVKSLSCDNEVMDYDMYEALKSSKYPYITLTLKEVYAADHKPVDLNKSTALVVTADLKLAGTTRTQQIRITASKTTDGQYVFRGSHEISLDDFNVDAPTALFGVIKVKDHVKINFDLHIKVG